MMNIDLSQSAIQQEASKNQFLMEGVTYQKCPNCQRQFFQGKLVCHLKLCTSQNPMYKTPLKSTRKNTSQVKSNERNFEKNPATPDITSYKYCQYCHSKLPSFMMSKHLLKCQNKNKNETQQQPIKNNTQADFRIKSDRSKQLPKINFTPKKRQSNNIMIMSKYTVKIRDQLRCFRKAQQVQKVTCSYCGRKFSNEASLRHIPICQNLKINQQRSIAIRRKTKSLITGRKLKNTNDEKLLFNKSIEKLASNSTFIDIDHQLKQENQRTEI